MPYLKQHRCLYPGRNSVDRHPSYGRRTCSRTKYGRRISGRRNYVMSFNIKTFLFRHYLPGGKIERLNVKHAIGMMTDFAYHGPIGTTVQLLTEQNSPPVYHYLFKYSATHSFGDVAIFPKWKITVKTWLHSFGLGRKSIQSQLVNRAFDYRVPRCLGSVS